MNTAEQREFQPDVMGIRKKIPDRLKMLDEQLKEEQNLKDNCSYTRQYTETMSDLVFDVVDHAISYTDKLTDLEVLRGRLLDATHTLDIAINVWSESQKKGHNWYR